MSTPKPNEPNEKPDNWTLHEELGKEYAHQLEMRGGKTIHQLVAEANAPRFTRRGKPRRGDKGRKP